MERIPWQDETAAAADTEQTVDAEVRVGGIIPKKRRPNLPPPRHRRDYLDDGEHHRHSRKVWWGLLIVLVGALIAGVALGYGTIATYRARLDLVPAIQNQLASAGTRLEAVENVLGNWSTEWEALRHRLDGIETKLSGTLRAARKQAEEITARSENRLENDLDQRSQVVQNQLDTMKASQQASDARMARLEEQLAQIQTANRQAEPANSQLQGGN